MISLKKDTNFFYEMITLKNGDSEFSIFYVNNSDLYWTCNSDHNTDTYSIKIDSANTYVFRLFDELYDSICSMQPFKYLNFDFNGKKVLFPPEINDSRWLLQDNKIVWYSDDYAYHVASVVYIEKKDNCFLITFKKGKTNIERQYPYSSFTVSFSNSDSKYDPYNIPFMDMFNKLKEYDFYTNQIGITNYNTNSNIKIRKREKK